MEHISAHGKNPPERRRGEPIPQELLDGVLIA